jgi:sulfur carrier protein
MNVKINGKLQSLDKKIKLSELIFEKSLDVNKIVIEYNSEIVDKKYLSDIFIKEGDTIEIVSFVGGG